jgi:hypothetical protein
MKTLLVDTHALYREGLALLITQSFPELELLRPATSPRRWRSSNGIPTWSCCCSTWSCPMPRDARGLQQIRARAPEVVVVLLSGARLPEPCSTPSKQAPPDSSRRPRRPASCRRPCAGFSTAASYLPPALLAARRGSAEAEPEAAPATASDLTA